MTVSFKLKLQILSAKFAVVLVNTTIFYSFSYIHYHPKPALNNKVSTIDKKQWHMLKAV